MLSALWYVKVSYSSIIAKHDLIYQLFNVCTLYSRPTKVNAAILKNLGLQQSLDNT